MYRYAEITSLIYPLQELQDRASLEIPAAFVKEEGIRESEDQRVAKYAIVYYRVANNEPAGDEMDVQPVLERLAQDVFSDYEVTWDIQHNERSRDTLETIVTVTWPEGHDAREASLRRADAPYDVFPLTVYADQDVYNVATDGGQFLVLKNGEPIVTDAPSPAYCLGSLVSILRDQLQEIEATAGVPTSPPNDFLAAMAMSVIDTPELADEAKEHFVKFYELTTLKDWEAEAEAQRGDDD